MRKVVSRDGTTIAYEKTGEGPPIVLLNGGFRDHTIFDPLVPELAPHCTTYVYDRRGRGESGDSPEYAVEREIEDLTAVIEAAGGESVVFAGSSGANLALEAAMAGAPITKLALHEPYFRIDGYPQPPADFLESLKALLAEDRRGDAVEYFLAELVGFTPDTIAEWRQTPLWAMNEANAHTLPYDAAICGDFKVPVERLAPMRVPSLVVSSDATSDWLSAAARATAEALPNGWGMELPGSWHRVQTDILGRVLAGFTATR
ncbi:alpha/beta fold hydrolase [Streptomyces sp. SID4919]|uniref:alpha/beta fold hydrolase n=1 Tax=unclassified Streptomyces TaxID=2593676 RepID=UPI00082382DD|nr:MULTISPECIES: alpha/beta hydrolase [unclassified Streptomyces]MYY11090.1 alpha/beta fold hydrolase [Streptomyces sp. SID4919]SCK15267.1 Pimeloyl-ACP methyl ester carboxylesterase [Streptomyces sp. AmelKG-E11A]